MLATSLEMTAFHLTSTWKYSIKLTQQEEIRLKTGSQIYNKTCLKYQMLLLSLCFSLHSSGKNIKHQQTKENGFYKKSLVFT